jgi:hypothetical protein
MLASASPHFGGSDPACAARIGRRAGLEASLGAEEMDGWCFDKFIPGCVFTGTLGGKAAGVLFYGLARGGLLTRKVDCFRDRSPRRNGATHNYSRGILVVVKPAGTETGVVTWMKQSESSGTARRAGAVFVGRSGCQGKRPRDRVGQSTPEEIEKYEEKKKKKEQGNLEYSKSSPSLSVFWQCFPTALPLSEMPTMRWMVEPPWRPSYAEARPRCLVPRRGPRSKA